MNDALAKTTTPLTNTQIERASPKTKEYTLADGFGLLLRIKPNGRKSWLFNYQRPFTQRRNNLSLGLYPEVSLKTARDYRAEARALLAIGVDPQKHREQASAAARLALEQTFQQIASTWFDVKKTEVTDDYADDIWRSLELHVFPSVGNLPIQQLKAPLVISAIKPLEQKGRLETIKRLCQRINEIMTFATNTGIIDSNPLRGISAAFPKPPKRHLPAIEPADLANLVEHINTAPISELTRSCLLWQLHTMVRPTEATGARWDEIDLINRIWTIPPERTKTKRTPHRVPLTDQSIALLNQLQKLSGKRAHLFPGTKRPNESMNPQSPNMALKRMGYGGKLVAHGLRTIASTTLNEAGWEPDLIEAALSHTGKNEVRNAYNRTDYLERRRPLMEFWSNHIEDADAFGRITKTRVVSLKRGVS